MKLLQTYLTVALSLGVVAGSFGADIQTYLTEGQTALIRGDTVAAKKAFEAALKINPKNPTAVGYLKQITIAEAKSPSVPQVEQDLQKLIIPQLQLKEATFAAALDFLKKKVAEISKGKHSINFVLQLSAEQQNTAVTLNLTNIPFTEALRYITELAGAKPEYQKFAIVIKPSGGASAQPATQTKELAAEVKIQGL